MNCDTPINHKDGIATIRAMSGWPMRPAFHLYKHLYKHHRRLTRRMFRGHPSLCACGRAEPRARRPPRQLRVMSRTARSENGPTPYGRSVLYVPTGRHAARVLRHCARGASRCATPRTVTISPKPSDCKGFVIASLGAGAHSVTAFRNHCNHWVLEECVTLCGRAR